MRAMYLFLLIPLFASCIGTDFVDEPLGPTAAEAVIDQANLSLLSGESQALTFRLLGSDGSIFPTTWTWSSREEAIATVDNNGLVTAIDPGQTWIDGLTEAGLRDSVLVTVVTDPNAVASVVIDGDSGLLAIGSIRQLQATVRNADNQIIDGLSLSWESVNPAVATVDNNGRVEALLDGKTQIQATAAGIRSVPFEIEVGSTPLIRQGTFSGRNGYNTKGTAELGDSGSGAVLAFKSDFSTQNGPGLYVYLSPNSNSVSGGISLGKLQATSGEQSYALPSSADPEDYDFVIIYCQPFGAPFGVAGLE